VVSEEPGRFFRDLQTDYSLAEQPMMERIVILSRRNIMHPSAGGASVYVHEIFRRLADRYDITVLSGSAEPSRPREIDGISYVPINMPLIRAFLPVKYLLTFSKKADLLIDNGDVGIPWCSPAYAKIPRIAIIHQLIKEIFYYEMPRLLADFGHALEPLVYRLYRGTRIVSVSKSTAEDLYGFGVPRTNISIIEPGCSNHNRRPSLEERSTATISCVCRLVRYKGLQFALHILPDVMRKYPTIVLDVVGFGPYARELQEAANDLGLSKNVHFHGKVVESRKFALYGRSRVAILPSVREGYGLSVLEANSVGTPVVGWDVPGLRDSVLNDTTGFLARFPDTDAFASRIGTLLEEDGIWQNLSDNAWEWAQRHSWDSSATKFRAVIEDVLSTGQPRMNSFS